MRVNVSNTRCPKCWAPVEVLESLRFAPDLSSVEVRSEPCGHEWDYVPLAV